MIQQDDLAIGFDLHLNPDFHWIPHLTPEDGYVAAQHVFRSPAERGVAALKASFVMMYAPENPTAKVQWEKAHPFFGPEDYGFTMENYGHGGTTSTEGVGIGTFTIYDWGNGAASEAYNRITDHFGHVYVDRTRDQAFGIDSIAVTSAGAGLELVDLADQTHKIRVVFEDGSETVLHLDQRVTLPRP